MVNTNQVPGMGINPYNDSEEDRFAALEKLKNQILDSGARVVNGEVQIFGQESQIVNTLEQDDNSYYYGIEATDQTSLEDINAASAEQARISDAAKDFYKFLAEKYRLEAGIIGDQFINGPGQEALGEEADSEYDEMVRKMNRAHSAMNFLNEDIAKFDEFLLVQQERISDPSYFTENGLRVPLSGEGEEQLLVSLINDLDKARSNHLANIEHGGEVDLSAVNLKELETKITALFKGANLDDIARLDSVFEAEYQATDRRNAYGIGGSYTDADGNTVTVEKDEKMADFWTYQTTAMKQLAEMLVDISGRFDESYADNFAAAFDELLVKRAELSETGFVDEASKAEFKTFFERQVKANAVANPSKFLEKLDRAYAAVNSRKDELVSNLETVDAFFAFNKLLANGELDLSDTAAVDDVAKQMRLSGVTYNEATGAYDVKDKRIDNFDLNGDGQITGIDIVKKFDIDGDGVISQEDLDFTKLHVLSQNRDYERIEAAVKFVDGDNDMDISVEEIQKSFTEMRATMYRRQDVHSNFNAAADFDQSGRVDYRDFQAMMLVIARSSNLEEFAASGNRAMNLVIGEIKQTQESLDTFSGLRYVAEEDMNDAETWREFRSDRFDMNRNRLAEQVMQRGASYDNRAAWALMWNPDRFQSEETEQIFMLNYDLSTDYRNELAQGYSDGDHWWYGDKSEARSYDENSLDKTNQLMWKHHDVAFFALSAGRTEHLDFLDQLWDNRIEDREEYYKNMYGLYGTERNRDQAALDLQQYQTSIYFRHGVWRYRNKDTSDLFDNMISNQYQRAQELEVQMDSYLAEWQANNPGENLFEQKGSPWHWQAEDAQMNAMLDEMKSITQVGYRSGIYYNHVEKAIAEIDANNDQQFSQDEILNALQQFRDDPNSLLRVDLDRSGEVNEEDLYFILAANGDYDAVVNNLNAVDTNKDGLLSESEQADAISSLASMMNKNVGEAGVTNKFDFNGDGRIDIKDYQSMKDDYGVAANSPEARLLDFALKFDANQDASFDETESEKAFEAMVEAFSSGGLDINSDGKYDVKDVNRILNYFSLDRSSEQAQLISNYTNAYSAANDPQSSLALKDPLEKIYNNMEALMDAKDFLGEAASAVFEQINDRLTEVLQDVNGNMQSVMEITMVLDAILADPDASDYSKYIDAAKARAEKNMDILTNGIEGDSPEILDGEISPAEANRLKSIQMRFDIFMSQARRYDTLAESTDDPELKQRYSERASLLREKASSL